MKPIRILVNSPGTSIGTLLNESLPDSSFSVLNSKPGPAFMELAHRAEIAVIDGIDDRPDAAQLEIALLKKMHPKIPIIVISNHSTERDIRVVEQGIFYYLAGAPEQKLIRVIHAAAEVVSRKKFETLKNQNQNQNLKT